MIYSNEGDTHMAKSLKRRKEVNRLLKSYKRRLKLHGEEVKNLSFGRIFKSDPWDCGDPGCYICHAVPKGKGHPVKVQKELDSFKDQLESLD
jgi:hypothetical protein